MCESIILRYLSLLLHLLLYYIIWQVELLFTVQINILYKNTTYITATKNDLIIYVYTVYMYLGIFTILKYIRLMILQQQ